MTWIILTEYRALKVKRALTVRAIILQDKSLVSLASIRPE